MNTWTWWFWHTHSTHSRIVWFRKLKLKKKDWNCCASFCTRIEETTRRTNEAKSETDNNYYHYFDWILFVFARARTAHTRARARKAVSTYYRRDLRALYVVYSVIDRATCVQLVCACGTSRLAPADQEEERKKSATCAYKTNKVIVQFVDLMICRRRRREYDAHTFRMMIDLRCKRDAVRTSSFRINASRRQINAVSLSLFLAKQM